MIRGLLFDLDGTLVDSASTNASAYLMALREFGVTTDLDDLEARSAGRNWRQFLPPILADAGSSADPAAVALRKQSLYAGMVGELPVNGALLSLLSACRGTFRTGLVTTASKVNVDSIVRSHGLRIAFDVIVTGDDVARHKPDPEAYLVAASRLGLPPGDCIVFEDSDIGVASATAAGMQSVRIVFEPGLDSRASSAVTDQQHVLPLP